MEYSALVLFGFIVGLTMNGLRRVRKGRMVYSPYGKEFVRYNYNNGIKYLCKCDASNKDWLLLSNKTIQYMGQTEIFN